MNNDQDAFPNDPDESSDLDGDGIGDNSDPDRDGDGVNNDQDAFPNDPTEISDLDGDGIGDNSDPDRDGDGVNNDQDAFPNDPDESGDLDGDGIGDNSDSDRDGDGFDNSDEEYPDDASKSTDRPQLEVFLLQDVSINADTILISGVASDAGSGIASVELLNDRFPGVPVSAFPDNTGEFSADVPLDVGYNEITIIATDNFGLSTQRQITVLRVAAPVLEISAPENNAVFAEGFATLSGTIFSYEPADQIRVTLGEHQQFAETTGDRHNFTFRFEAYPLQPGQNPLEVIAVAPAGSDSDTVTLVYDAPDENDNTGPEITVITPQADSHIQDDVLIVNGVIHDPSGVQSLTINGAAITLEGVSAELKSYTQNTDISGTSGSFEITLEATDIFGNTSTVVRQVFIDREGPALTIISPNIDPLPAINAMATNPIIVFGEVVDSALAGLTINGEAITLTPGNQPDQYLFEFALQISQGESLPLRILAWDRSGNRVFQEYQFQYSAVLSMEILKPLDGANLRLDSSPGSVELIARVQVDSQNVDRYVARSLAGESALSVSGELASGQVAVDAQSAEQILVVEAQDINGTVLASSTINIKVIDLDDLPLELISITPENGSENVEPNQFLQLNFNKAIDASKLDLTILETVHGETYNTDQSNTPSLGGENIGGLVEIVRNQEPVPGGLSILPGNMTVAFYPQRDMAYGGRVFVDITYDGEEIARTFFQIRPRPTFIQGIVTDQFLLPIAGIEVMLMERDLTATTDSNGSFAFGFGLSAEEDIKGGRYTIVANSEGDNPGYGRFSRWAVVDEGQLNRVGLIKIPQLNQDIPYRRIASGNANDILAAGELVLDLSATELRFDNLRDNGDVHVQFHSFSELPIGGIPAAMPQWAYGVQPHGIEVEGEIGVTIQAPALYGSYAYLPPDNSPVLLLGYDPDVNLIMPVGVGRVQGTQVTGTGVFKRLDYFTYALVNPNFYSDLEALDAGEISVNELIGRLEAAR